MEKVRLGKSGIEVSRLGMGTGTANPSGICIQSGMDVNELAGLLVYAFEKGINFWDTAFRYGTYPHIREALRRTGRDGIVLATKFITSSVDDTLKDFESSLRALDTDYLDICLLHGVRTRIEFKKRLGALETLIRLRDEGKVVAVGFSSHGLGALRYGLGIPDLDVVWARINHAGLNMDTADLGIYDRLSSIPILRKIAEGLPRRVISLIRPAPDSQKLTPDERSGVEAVLNEMHSRKMGVVGMKVLAEGLLKDDPEKAVGYVKGLSFIDAYVMGMMSKNEIDENIRLTGAAG
jgi:aryl-alcohol dehydrogenase-like predicted oxidoreductase